jgi:hypothetical protein
MQDYIKGRENAVFENISVDQTDKSTMTVFADLLIPSDSVFTFAENEELVAILESRLNKDVLLNLRIQNIIEPITKDQLDNTYRIDSLSDKLVQELENLDSSYKISSIRVSSAGDNSGWTITADVLTTQTQYHLEQKYQN